MKRDIWLWCGLNIELIRVWNQSAVWEADSERIPYSVIRTSKFREELARIAIGYV